MGERGRTNNLSYIDSYQDVADVHYEVARITKRASWSFTLLLEGLEVLGTMQLRTLGSDLLFVGVTRSQEERDRREPTSAMRRGGAPSSMIQACEEALIDDPST